MSITRVQTKAFGLDGSTLTTIPAFDNPVTIGNLIVFSTSHWGSQNGIIIDGFVVKHGSDNMAQVIHANAGADDQAEQWYRIATTTSQSVNCADNQYWEGSITEYSSTTGWPADPIATSGATPTAAFGTSAAPSASCTTTAPNCVIVTSWSNSADGFGDDGAPSGYTRDYTTTAAEGGGGASKIVTSAGVQTPVFSLGGGAHSVPWACVIAAYAANASGTTYDVTPSDTAVIPDTISTDKLSLKFIQQSTTQLIDTATGSPVTANMPGNFTAGNSAIICVAAAPNPTVDTGATVTANGVSATLVHRSAGIDTGGYKIYAEIWLAQSLPGGGSSFIYDPSIASGFYAFSCAEFAGLAASAADVSADGTVASSLAPTATTPTLSQRDELVVGIFSSGQGVLFTCADPSGWSTAILSELDGNNHQTGKANYKVVSSTTPVTVAWSIGSAPSEVLSTMIASFKINVVTGGGTGGTGTTYYAYSVVTF